MNTFELILPIFGIILTGWAFVKFKIFSEDVANTLIQFAYKVAVPALLFASLATQPLERIFDWKLIFVFGGASLLVYFVTLAIALIFMRHALSKAVLIASSASFSNAGFIGLPILVALFGTKGAIPAAITIFILVAFIFPITIFIIEFAKQSDKNKFRLIGKTLKGVLMNPLIFSTIIGIAYASTPWPMPNVLGHYCKLLAAALTPCALFAIGMHIKASGIQKHWHSAGAITVAKLIILPAIVYFLALHFKLTPIDAIAAILVSGVPTAKAVFILSESYDIDPEYFSTVIVSTTLFSVVTLFVLLLCLSHTWPHLFTGQIAAAALH